MPVGALAIGVSAALELIKFVMTTRGLQDKTPEQVLEMWAATRLDVRKAIDEWRATEGGIQ